MKNSSLAILFVLASLFSCNSRMWAQQAVLSGELKKWHPITLTFTGPATSEQAAVNPFTEYRLQVTFQNGTTRYVVPGYYAADGDAAQSGAFAGDKWRVHFTPDAEGTWTWTAAFRNGPMIAIDPDSAAGTAVAFNGETGSFQIGPTDKSGRDHRGKGRLRYVGKHHLQFAETGEYFVKGGADAPEVFLAYQDFDSTYQHGGNNSFLKHWTPHVRDWQVGDPSWQNGKGKGIIGALNYLAGTGANAFSFLTMNVTGDGKNVWPWTSHTERFRFDVSKLAQWEMVFSHADMLGLYLHFKTQETENDQLLDNGALGPERKMYYRELVARFSHHLALNWNLGEENTQTTGQRRDMAAYFHAEDPYQHNIVIHTYPGQHSNVYSPLLGTASELTGASIQTNWSNVHTATLNWLNHSAQAGKPWVVANDEQGNANTGVTPDTGYPNFNGSSNHDDIRKQTLWGNLMAGGAGVEYYFGYSNPESDLTCNDWRSRSVMWSYTNIALEFFREYLPFWDMVSEDGATFAPDDFCLRYGNALYAIYLPNGGSTDIDLDTATVYHVYWFNPRTGGNLQQGVTKTVQGPGDVPIGQAPSDPGADWVVLLSQFPLETEQPTHFPKEVLKLFPNPTRGRLELEWPKSLSEVGLASVYDMQGRLVARRWVRQSSPGRGELQLYDLAPGKYLLVFYQSPDYVSGQFIVE